MSRRRRWNPDLLHAAEGLTTIGEILKSKDTQDKSITHQLGFARMRILATSTGHWSGGWRAEQLKVLLHISDVLSDDSNGDSNGNHAQRAQRA